ncbi:MAG: adenylate/guanylate cyclase domain-containing protein [Desulfocapsaceae bacterium]|nr:adenylate/guanylate cyclase domain-containing protein [Desulfocapsaceae bacterium]
MNDTTHDISARKIVVVDAERLSLDMSRAALEQSGHHVTCAYTGEEAVELAATMHFELAVISVVLPGINGIETFVSMRMKAPSLAGILLSTPTDSTLIVEAMNQGFDGVIEKPLNPDNLVKVVNETLVFVRSREENTRLKTLAPLYRLGEKFLSATSAEQIYNALLEAVSREIHVPSISLMMFDEASGRLKIVASRGMSKELAETISIKPGEQIAGWVYEKGKPVILNKLTQHYSPFSRLLTRDAIAASISFPLVSRDRVIGVINISQMDSNIEYSQSDIEMLSVITGQAVMALENVASMAERENAIRVRAMLEQYVAPEVAELLMASKHNLMDVGGVQEITVLFADIRNFTHLVQHLPPEKLRIFLNAFFDIFSNVVFSWKGTLDKFMGDAVLAIFGAPITLEKASYAGVSAACQILHEFEILQKRWMLTSVLFQDIGLGIGMSKGEMFLGNVGSSRRLDYTVIGTDVNIAQRLAADAKSGQILVTGTVHADIGEDFPFRKEKARVLRGLEKEVELYSLALPERNGQGL